MKEYLAYIDETGDPDFNESSSETFFVGAIILAKENYKILDNKVENIKKKFNISEFKSSNQIGTTKRYEIFNELIELDFNFVSILVEKNKLSGKWFRFRDKFYKFIQGKLNHEIHMLFENVQVKLDKFGSPRYQESFRNYLVKSLQEELFSPQIEISSHKYETFIQIADFISGSINWLIKNDPEYLQGIWRLILPKWIKRIKIPSNKYSIEFDLFKENDEYFDVCVSEVDKYLQKKNRAEDTAKFKTLEYLLYSAYESPESYIYTAEILNWLNEINLKLSEEQFRNEVIASLRDEGLIIVGTRKGLKIPTRNEDLVEYINFSTNLTLPILKRLKKAITFIEIKIDNKKFLSSLNVEMKRILNEIDA